MLVLWTSSQPDGVGQKPSVVAQQLKTRGIRLYSMGAGKKFSKEQALWSASFAGHVYHTYNFRGQNDVPSFGVPMANAVLQSE